MVSKFAAWFIGALVLLLATAAIAQHSGPSFPATGSVTGTRAAVGVSGAVINWSLLGVVADSVTDNTAALAALPPNVTIVGDCPAGGSIRFSQWLLKSNQAFRLLQTCPLVSTLTSPSSGSGRLGVISQADPTTPITNVSIDGLNMARVAIPPTQVTGAGCTGAQPYYCGYMMYLNVDHFSLTNFHFDTYNGGIFMTGSDVEIGYGLGTNSSHGSQGNGCVTYMATHPGVVSTGTKPINPFTGLPATVWVHDLGTAAQPFGSADGCFQLAPQLVGVVGAGTADGIIFENSYVHSDGPCFLIGSGSRALAVPIGGSITNFVFRNIQGKCDNTAILAQAGLMPHLGFEHGLIQNVTFDNSSDTISPQAILIDVPSSLTACSPGPLCGPNGLYADGHITDLTLSNVTINGAYGRALYIYGTGSGSADAGIKSVTVNGLTSAVQRSGVRDAIQVKGVAPNGVVSINNYTVAAGAAGVVFDARSTGTPLSLSNGIITGTPLNSSCIVIQSFDSGTVSNNVCQPAAGVATANGIVLTNFALASASVAACGAGGYVAGDTVNVSGGTQTGGIGQVDINAVDGSGCPTVVAVSVGGGYSVIPSSPAATTGGTGSGLTLNVVQRNGTSNSTVINNDLSAMPALNRIVCTSSILNNLVINNIGASNCSNNAVLWSALGVTADGVTDNSAALAALPTGVPVVGDCPAGGAIMFTQWLISSNTNIAMNSGCPMQATGQSQNYPLGYGAITQTDLTTPVQNIQITGLVLSRTAIPPAQATGAGCTGPNPQYCGSLIYLNTNHFTLTHFAFDTYNSGMFIAGSDIEIGWGMGTNAAAGSQANGFIRFHAENPGVSSTGAKPINPLTGTPALVWIHDLGTPSQPVQSGDAVLQISPNNHGFGVGSTDNIIFENSYTLALTAPCILLGTGGRVLALPFLANWTNFVFRNISGTCDKAVLTMASSNNSNMGFVNGLLQNLTFDNVNDNVANNALILNTPVSVSPCSPGPTCCNGYFCIGIIDQITIQNVTVNNAHSRSLFIAGPGVGRVSVNGFTANKPRVVTRASVQVSGVGSNAVIGLNNLSIVANALGVVLDPRAAGSKVSLTNSTITNIAQTKNCITLDDIDSGTVTGNTCAPASGVTAARGISLTYFVVSTSSVASCAGGYVAGDLLTLVGGGVGDDPGIVSVDEVDGSGCPTAMSLSYSGVYTTFPTNPVSVTGGSGTGITLNLVSKFGTTNTIVTGNNVSAMPSLNRVVCASGLGNTVTGNTGASDCPP